MLMFVLMNHVLCGEEHNVCAVVMKGIAIAMFGDGFGADWTYGDGALINCNSWKDVDDKVV